MALTSVVTRGEISGSGTTLSGSSSSIAAGKAFAVIVRWSGTAGTISGTPTITGETVTLNAASHAVSADNDHCQILIVESAAATGTKSLSVTFSASSSACGAMFVEINGNLTGSSWLGAVAVLAASNSTVPSMSLTTAAAGSGILACAMTSGNAGAPTGTGAVQIALADNWQYEDAQYNLDVGAAGAKTVAWTTAVSSWAVSAIEIKATGGGGGGGGAVIVNTIGFGA